VYSKEMLTIKESIGDRIIHSSGLREHADASIGSKTRYNDKFIIQSVVGKRILPVPIGRIVPRIC
jgi:hypothetical protein